MPCGRGLGSCKVRKVSAAFKASAEVALGLPALPTSHCRNALVSARLQASGFFRLSSMQPDKHWRVHLARPEYKVSSFRLHLPRVLSSRPALTRLAEQKGSPGEAQPAGCRPGAGSCAGLQVAGLARALAAEDLLASECSGWLQTAGGQGWQPSQRSVAREMPALPSGGSPCPCSAAHPALRGLADHSGPSRCSLSCTQCHWPTGVACRGGQRVDFKRLATCVL